MRLPALRQIVLYTALSLTANPAAAGDLATLRTGEMKKLVVYDQPLAVPDLPFVDETGAEARLADFRGKVVLLNFWATWCAPCREEMPALDQIQKELGGTDFQVVTLATGRNPQSQITRFFTEARVEHLPRYQDERQVIARGMGIVGLPVTVLIDRDGLEVARLIGGADWASPEARALITALIKG